MAAERCGWVCGVGWGVGWVVVVVAGGPRDCSHSNIIFADVDISLVLATFCVDVYTARA